MNHSTDIMLGKNRIECRSVAHISLDKGDSCASNCFDALQAFMARIGKIVNNDDVKSCRNQLNNGVATNIPSATSD